MSYMADNFTHTLLLNLKSHKSPSMELHCDNTIERGLIHT